MGDRLALTPPMGWNSWNCFASAVTEKNVRDAADAFVQGRPPRSRLDVHQHRRLLDAQERRQGPDLHGPDRDPSGKINANPRFPDMKALTDYIHA